MAFPYALHIATEIGPRAKKDPNSVLMGEDSVHPDAHAAQYSPEHGPGSYDNASGMYETLKGKYTVHAVPWLAPHKAHAFAYLIRAGSFTAEEVLKMAEALK